MTYQPDRAIQNHSWRQDAAATGATKPAPSWEQTKEDCVGPDLPGDDTQQDRLTDEIDRRRDVEAQLAKMTDAHAVVSQRLIGAQKEVAERDATIDELRGALESIAAHVGLVGSDQWAVDEIVVKVDDATARADKAEDRLRRDDDLRSAIAIAVGLDGSASLALILDTVTRDRPDDPRAVNGLRALVAYHQAPIAFNDRPLPLAERASFVIRRLWQGRTNAANEAASLRRELSDIADALGDLPDTAEREPIGDREEHLGLSTAERLRLHFGARS